MFFSPRVRQTLYVIGTMATGLISIVAMWNGISGEAATSLSNAINAIAGLLGVGATATATAAVTRQQKSGAFEDRSPAELAIRGIEATVAQAANAKADFERVKTAASETLKDIPVVGPLAQQVIDSVNLS